MTDGSRGWSRGAARRPALTIAVTVLLALSGALLATHAAPVDRQRHVRLALVRELPGDRHRPPPVRLRRGRHPGPGVAAEPRLHQGPGDGQLPRGVPGRAVPRPERAARSPSPRRRPAAHAPYGGWNSPCGQLMRHRPVQVVYGPGHVPQPRGRRGQPGGRLRPRAPPSRRSAPPAPRRGSWRSAAASRRRRPAKAAKAAETLENQQQTASLVPAVPRFRDQRHAPDR